MSKAAREAAEQLDNHGLLHCKPSGVPLGGKLMRRVISIIDEVLTPEREAAKRLRDAAYELLHGGVVHIRTSEDAGAEWVGNLTAAITHFDAVTGEE